MATVLPADCRVDEDFFTQASLEMPWRAAKGLAGSVTCPDSTSRRPEPGLCQGSWNPSTERRGRPGALFVSGSFIHGRLSQGPGELGPEAWGQSWAGQGVGFLLLLSTPQNWPHPCALPVPGAACGGPIPRRAPGPSSSTAMAPDQST